MFLPNLRFLLPLFSTCDAFMHHALHIPHVPRCSLQNCLGMGSLGPLPNIYPIFPGACCTQDYHYEKILTSQVSSVVNVSWGFFCLGA